MIHPKYGTEEVVAPHNVKRRQDMGWKLKTDPSAEVIEFQKKNEMLTFVEKKKDELKKCDAGCVTKIDPPVKVAPVVIPEPVIPDEVPGVDEKPEPVSNVPEKPVVKAETTVKVAKPVTKRKTVKRRK